jgi:MoaA/NifB/PqqE/SkfB family radical SAM enzyme
MIAGLVLDRAPRRVYWEVTRACDLACRHCRAEATSDPDPRELTSAEGLWLLDRLAACEPPAPHMVLTGGDPLKRSDLFLLIERATALGLPVSVAPSGTPRLTGEVIRLLRAAGVEAISLGLDGSDAASHDTLRGVPGCFERTVAAARAAAAERLPFQVNTLVSQETFDDLPAIWAATADLGAARWSLFFLVAVGRGRMLRPISAEACERLLGWLADRSSEGGPVVGTTEAPHFRRVLLERARRWRCIATGPGAGGHNETGFGGREPGRVARRPAFLPVLFAPAGCHRARPRERGLHGGHDAIPVDPDPDWRGGREPGVRALPAGAETLRPVRVSHGGEPGDPGLLVAASLVVATAIVLDRFPEMTSDLIARLTEVPASGSDTGDDMKGMPGQGTR